MAYGKVEESFWNHHRNRDLSEQARLFLLYLLTNRHKNRLGLYVLPPAYAAEDLQWTGERVVKVIGELKKAGFVEYDDRTRCVFLRRFLKHNTMENANVVAAAMKELETVPATPLLAALLEVVQRYRRPHYRLLIEELRNHIANRVEKVQQTNLLTDGGGLTPDSPKPNQTKPEPSQAKPSQYDEQFLFFWRCYPKRNNPGSKSNAAEIWEKAVCDGVTPDLIQARAEQYAQWCLLEGIVGTGKVAMATTWLNGKRWEVELEFNRLSEADGKLLKKVKQLEGIDLETSFQ